MKKIAILCLFGFLGLTAAAQENTNKSKSDYVDSNTVQVKPEYPGGIGEFYKLIGPKIDKARGKHRGKMYIKIIIDKDGSISETEIIKGLDPDVDKKISDILLKSPKWNPGIQNGQPVRASYNLPLTFK